VTAIDLGIYAAEKYAYLELSKVGMTVETFNPKKNEEEQMGQG
jgi:hypothetical protein